jgi:putative transposase
LFKSKEGIIINADVNGAYNILKKTILKAFTSDGKEDVELHPVHWQALEVPP